MKISLLNLVILTFLSHWAEANLNLADVPCGKIARGSRKLYARIRGGVPIEITDFPHAVSLRKHDKHHCGGALIHRNFVVTAAHCVHSAPEDVWTVVVGEQNSNSLDEHEQKISVEKIHKYPDFTFPKFVYDLALVRLSEPVQWSQYAQPVCLPETNTRTGRGLGYLAGWGFDHESKYGGSPTENLHMTKLPILSNDECKEWFWSQNKKIKLKPVHLCAGYEDGLKDGCQGDSGSGLVAVDKRELVLLGVMSAGIGCGRAKLPGLYTRVEKFVDWIKEIVAEDEKKRFRRSLQSNWFPKK